jgi:hypothetical protein
MTMDNTMDHTMDHSDSTSDSPLKDVSETQASVDLDTDRDSLNIEASHKMCGTSGCKEKHMNVTASSFVPTTERKNATNAPSFGLDSLSLNNNFTPSTPYVHKFRTELCKNFALHGKCKYGDEVSKFIQFLKPE